MCSGLGCGAAAGTGLISAVCLSSSSVPNSPSPFFGLLSAVFFSGLAGLVASGFLTGGVPAFFSGLGMVFLGVVFDFVVAVLDLGFDELVDFGFDVTLGFGPGVAGLAFGACSTSSGAGGGVGATLVPPPKMRRMNPGLSSGFTTSAWTVATAQRAKQSMNVLAARKVLGEANLIFSGPKETMWRGPTEQRS